MKLTINFFILKLLPKVTLFEFQGLLESTAASVTASLEDKLWLGQFTVVIPSHWRQHMCQVEFKTAKGQTRYKVAILHITNFANFL